MMTRKVKCAIDAGVECYSYSDKEKETSVLSSKPYDQYVSESGENSVDGYYGKFDSSGYIYDAPNNMTVTEFISLVEEWDQAGFIN